MSASHTITLDAQAIGRRLRKLRKARGVRQRTVERATGLFQGFLSLVECGRRLPTIQQLAALRGYYKRSLDFLAFGTPRNVRWER